MGAACGTGVSDGLGKATIQITLPHGAGGNSKLSDLIGTARCSLPKGDGQPVGCPKGKRSAAKAACRVV